MNKPEGFCAGFSGWWEQTFIFLNWKIPFRHINERELYIPRDYCIVMLETEKSEMLGSNFSMLKVLYFGMWEFNVIFQY